MDDLERWRDEFPILSRTVYMISNSLGAMPRQTARNLAEYADTWATRGVRGWEERWWEMPIEVGNKIARIIGAPAGTVSMHENVTTAHMVALSCLRPSGQRRRIVCTAMDFPSMLYLYRAQQALGFEVTIVPAEDDLRVRTDRLLDAIDDTTAVVAFSHVLFRTSYIMDAAAIARRAREVGATVILDTYQSAGIIPVDVTALGVDFAVGGCLKWLCGGPGNAFLYTRPELRKRVRPAFTGWVSHRNPFAFDTDPVDEHDVREDAMGMMNGTPSIPAYYAALAGLDIINEVGVDRIRARVDRADRAAARARRRARLHVRGVAGSATPGRNRRDQRAGRTPGGAHAQGARLHRRLPPAGRRPHLAALLQHDGRGRSRDGGDRVDRREEGLRGRRRRSLVT